MYPSCTTLLQQGHKDPNKELTIDNVIPQCNKCNQSSRNYFIYDDKGKVNKINDPNFILRSSKDMQLQTLRLLVKKYPAVAEEYLK